MGNSQPEDNNRAQPTGQKIILKLRYRDIILHYSFKMKLTIADIGIFPDQLEGLRLWDQDIVLSRFIILENERFKNKEAMVFKAGVGIAGITLSKWGGCKSITMCDTKPEVVNNISRNCERNNVHDAYSVLINLAQFGNYQRTYDIVLCTDLLGKGFSAHVILNIWRKLLKVGGEATMLVADKKEQSKKFLEMVDREEFKISNLILTAEEYEASPLFNKLEAESEFPLLGKSTFYAIGLTKLKEINPINESPAKLVAAMPRPQSEVQQQKPASQKKRDELHVSRPAVPEREEQRKQNIVEPTEAKATQEKPKVPQIAVEKESKQEQSPINKQLREEKQQEVNQAISQEQQQTHAEAKPKQQGQPEPQEPKGTGDEEAVQQASQTPVQEHTGEKVEEAPRHQDSAELEES